MSVGLVHDYLLVLRGAERSFAAMCDEWPSASIYTTLYDEEGTNGRFAGRTVHTSFLQRTGVRQRGFRRLLPLFPAAVERLPVGEHDVLVSSSSAWAHGVRPGPGAVHVCYCYTPFRYAWHERATALAEMPRPLRPAVGLALDRVRRWDLAAQERVTRYVAISEISRDRIAECYGRESDVVHPPVEIERFARLAPDPGSELLIVCELVAHKRVDVALAAARRAGRRVRIVGSGPEQDRLAAAFGDVATFLGRVDDAQLEEEYSRALAVVLPNVEEFGIAAVEAQAAGRPVIAVDAGGARETVLPGRTGVLVAREEAALAEAMHDEDLLGYDAEVLRDNAQRFSPAAFRRALREQVEAAVATGGDPSGARPPARTPARSGHAAGPG